MPPKKGQTFTSEKKIHQQVKTLMSFYQHLRAELITKTVL